MFRDAKICYLEEVTLELESYLLSTQIRTGEYSLWDAICEKRIVTLLHRVFMGFDCDHMKMPAQATF